MQNAELLNKKLLKITKTMIIENSKTYNVNDVENLFFRPTFCGKAAEELGIRVLYNMPLPTKVPVFSHNNNILKNFKAGWQGGTSATLLQREIEMSKLKAESSYSADDYFSTIYEIITNSSDVNLGDLTGTDLEKAETELFRRSLADSIYATTWFGDTTGTISQHTSFDGFLAQIVKACNEEESNIQVTLQEEECEYQIENLFNNAWHYASDDLRALVSEGNLAFFVSSDIYDAYHFYLDEKGVIDVSAAGEGCRPMLTYHGIPLVEVPSKGYNLTRCESFCILTDRRNLVLALNTADSPEKEIRMWYNPDEMENRQRVVFLAGTTIVDEKLLSGDLFLYGVSFN